MREASRDGLFSGCGVKGHLAKPEVLVGSLFLRQDPLNEDHVLMAMSLVTDSHPAPILDLDASSGSWDFSASGLPMQFPFDMTRDLLGNLYVVDSNGKLLKQQLGPMVPFSSGGLLPSPRSIITFVPEPGTWILAGTAAAFCWVVRRRKARR